MQAKTSEIQIIFKDFRKWLRIAYSIHSHGIGVQNSENGVIVSFFKVLTRF